MAGEPISIIRHQQTGKEVRGHVSWAVCTVGGLLAAQRTDKPGVFQSSEIIRITPLPRGQVGWEIETRNSVYHVTQVTNNSKV